MNKWCLGRNFNVVREVGEKINSNSVTRSMKTFNELLRETGLMDSPLRNTKLLGQIFVNNQFVADWIDLCSRLIGGP